MTLSLTSLKINATQLSSIDDIVLCFAFCIVMLSVVMLIAFVVSVTNKPVVLSVIMLSVFILSFVAPNVT
jgi:hypothetical protein